jgi:hydroxymethylpyrimidine pyrophosphatase-like HAD family hydrolase
MQIEPEVVSSLEENLITTDSIKIEAFAKNKEEMPHIESLLKSFTNDIHILWTMHATILPYQICDITVKNVSKKSAALEVLQFLNIQPADVLGIGDTLGDWNFIEMCKYAATVGDESTDLKDLVKTKGEGNYFYGSSVDENGLLDIFNYFKI